MSGDEKKNEIINSVLEKEFLSKENKKILNISSYKKIPIAGIIAMGGAFSTLPGAFRTVTQSVLTNNGEKLYRRIDSINAEMIRCKDGSGIITGVVKNNGKFAQAKLEEVTNLNGNFTQKMPYDPTTLFMAAALMEIEKTLKNVQENTERIIEFLEEDKKAQLRGNLTTLEEIRENYKYNVDNEMALSNYHMKVLDVKNHAIQQIEFYRNDIQGLKEKNELTHNLHIGKNVEEKANKINSQLQNYRLSLYIFSFASLLEVMISKNFDSDFLGSICKKLEDMSLEYREVYSDCYTIIYDDAATTIEKNILNAVEHTSRSLSDTKLTKKAGMDKFLTDTAAKAEHKKNKKINAMSELILDSRNSMVQPFVTAIQDIDKLYNAPVNVLIDDEYLYLQTES